MRILDNAVARRDRLGHLGALLALVQPLGLARRQEGRALRAGSQAGADPDAQKYGREALHYELICGQLLRDSVATGCLSCTQLACHAPAIGSRAGPGGRPATVVQPPVVHQIPDSHMLVIHL